MSLVASGAMALKETRRLPPQIRRKALEQLSRDRLLDITDSYGLDVEDRRVIDDHIIAIMRSRSVNFEDILEGLTRDELKDICAALSLDESGREKAPLIDRILSLAEDEPRASARSPGPPEPAPRSEVDSQKTEPLGTATLVEKDPRKVFIIHGRERAIVEELKRFLKAMGLQAWSFVDESHEVPHNTHIAEIVARGVSKTKAVIALLTPDEFACLVPDLRGSADSERDVRRWQPRPNVIYEAGMAMALNREGTILVTVGQVDMPSDLDGILSVRMSNAIAARIDLRKKLMRVGCAVDLQLEDWMDSAQGGSFDISLLRKMPTDPFTTVNG